MASTKFGLLLSLKRWLHDHGTPAKLYIFALTAFLICLLLEPIRRLGLVSPTKQSQFFLLGTVLGTVALTIEMKPLLSSLWAALIGKMGIAVFAIIAANISVILARHEINSISKLDPSNFPSATVAISVIFALFAWSFMFSILVFIYSFLLFLYFLILMQTKNPEFQPVLLFIRKSLFYRLLFRRRTSGVKRTSPAKMILRLMTTSVLIYLLFKAVIFLRPGGPIRKVTTLTFVLTEYYKYSNCSNQKEHEGIAFLKDGRISVAIVDFDGNITFETRDCN